MDNEKEDLLKNEIPEPIVLVFRKMKLYNLWRMAGAVLFLFLYGLQIIYLRKMIEISQILIILFCFVYLLIIFIIHLKINKVIATDDLNDINIFFEILTSNWYFYIGISGFILLFTLIIFI
jgi:hypothetical protein